MEWSEDRGEVELKGEGGEMKMEVNGKTECYQFSFHQENNHHFFIISLVDIYGREGTVSLATGRRPFIETSPSRTHRLIRIESQASNRS